MDEQNLAANLAHWDEVAEYHRESYDTASFVSDPTCIGKQVSDDAALLAPWLPDGSIAGLDLIHLQCHIGDDTLGWAKLGANVTGLDMSGESIRIAHELATESGLQAQWIQSTIADAANALKGQAFDVVYTSVGVLWWLDDLSVWADLIAQILRPGGVFFIREIHPMASALDDKAPPGELRLGWPYFNIGPILDESDQDYSSPAPVTNAKTYGWTHDLGEIIGSLLKSGLTVLDYQEHKTLPWKLLPWMEKENDNPWTRFVLPETLQNKCPLEFSLVARKTHVE